MNEATTIPTSDREKSGRHAMPKVSIGLPVHNGARFLTAAIESLLAQDFSDLELVLADNGSTDQSPEICRAFAERDTRVRYLPSDKNRGAAWNFNRTLEVARGQYFKWAAHDDLYAPEYLRACVTVLDQEPAVVLCHSGSVDIDEDGKILASWDDTGLGTATLPATRFKDLILRAGPCLHAFGIVRTNVLRRTPGIGAYSSSDIPLLAELALHGRFHQVPGALFLHREHEHRSIRLYPQDRGRAEWFDPRLRGRVTYPAWRLLREYERAIRRTPLSMQTRLQAYSALGEWLYRYRDRAARELAWGVHETLRQRVSRPADPTRRP